MRDVWAAAVLFLPQDNKADVILKYNADEARSLKAYGELPEHGEWPTRIRTWPEREPRVALPWSDLGELLGQTV